MSKLKKIEKLSGGKVSLTKQPANNFYPSPHWFLQTADGSKFGATTKREVLDTALEVLQGESSEDDEKESDRQYWEDNFPHWKIAAFDLGAGKLTAAEQSLHLTGGIQAYLQALSTPQHLSNLKADSIPPTRK